MSASNRIVVSGTTLILSPELAKHFGKSAALVLQQVHYWLSKQNMSYGIVENGVQWIRNSYKQWQEQIPHISISTIRRAFSILEEKQIILSKTYENAAYFSGGDQVKYFTINYDALETSIGNLSDIRIHKPGCIISRENRAGDAVQNQQKKIHALVKMNTPPVQNEHPPMYITKTTSEKTSLSGNLVQIEAAQSHSAEDQRAMPDRPAERDKINISKEMISLWIEIVELSQNEIALNNKRSQYLNAAFKKFFNSDLAHWEAFCCKIASSKFLMGEVKPFKASIDWAIRFDTIQRILEGAYSFGDRVVNYTPRIKVSEEDTGIDLAAACLHNEKHTHGDTKQESQEALAIRHHVRQRVGDAIYQSWFQNTNIILEENADKDYVATIYVSSRFIADRLRTHYADIVETYFHAIYVGEPPKTESVGYCEIKSNEPVIPFIELLVTVNNAETMSEYAPELSNQVALDMSELQEIPVDTHKEEFSDAERVQHTQGCISLINDESHNIDCEINMKTVNQRSRAGEAPLTNHGHEDIFTNVIKRGLLCELQANRQRECHSTKHLQTRNQRPKPCYNTEKIKQRELNYQERHFLKTPPLSEYVLNTITEFYANIRSMWYRSFSLYSQKRRAVIVLHTTRMVAGDKFLRRAIHLMCCKAAAFIDNTNLDPALSFCELKLRFKNNVLYYKTIV